MTLAEYKQKLAQHDWFYYFSDDHRVWSAGERSSKAVFNIAATGDASFKQAYNEVHAKHFNTNSFVTETNPYKSPFKL